VRKPFGTGATLPGRAACRAPVRWRLLAGLVLDGFDGLVFFDFFVVLLIVVSLFARTASCGRESGCCGERRRYSESGRPSRAA
jgi:hypothetical protein